MLSQKTRYALKALLELASLPAGATLSSTEISMRRTIPVKFLESILAELKRGGVVYGRRGRTGGYQLARSPQAISFGAVLRLIEGPLALLPCASVTRYRRCADCTEARVCELQTVFRELRDSTATILDAWTVADALGRSATRKYPGEAAAVKKANGARAGKKAGQKRRPKASPASRARDAI